MLFESMCWVFADANVKALSARTPQRVDEIWLSADSRHGTKMKRAQVRFSALSPWLRGLDLNQRPSGYEPDELPGCSTPRHRYYATCRFSANTQVPVKCAMWR
jgi:hypothetical protein